MRSILRSLALCALLLTSCTGNDIEATEVVLVVDSDLAPPNQINRVAVEVFDALGVPMGATANLMVGDLPLPRTLGLVNDGNRLGPFRVTATAFLNGTTVVSRTASFTFVRDRIMQLRLSLNAACQEVACMDADQSCNGNGVCADIRAELEDYDGTL